MTTTELADNLTYLSAIRMLERLVGKNLLTEAEAEAARKELKRKFRPTI